MNPLEIFVNNGVLFQYNRAALQWDTWFNNFYIASSPASMDCWPCPLKKLGPAIASLIGMRLQWVT